MRSLRPEGIIFDMDGCLYPFDRGSGKIFGESQFGQSIKAAELRFVQERLGVDASTAAVISRDLKDRYEHHLSLALEFEHGIPREQFFAATWDLAPADFIDQQPDLPRVLGSLSVRTGLLTAAPKVWADRVLDHLGVRSFFEPRILCGDQDVRKPDVRAFAQTAALLELPPERIISIGDQDHTDILPAQQLGMITVRIGSNIETAADFLACDVPDAINQLTEVGLL